jgi:predicted transcriptional regulator
MSVLTGKGSMFILVAFTGLIVLALMIPTPVMAQQTEITVVLDQEEEKQKIDFTLSGDKTTPLTGNITVYSESALPVTVFCGIHAPEGWVTTISPEEFEVTIGTTTISFEGEVIPNTESTQGNYEIYVWASAESRSYDGIDWGSTSTSSDRGQSIFEIIQNRILMLTNFLEQKVLPDATIRYEFTVTNVGTVQDTFFINLENDVVLQSQGWVISKSIDDLTLEPGESDYFYVDQQIPSDAPVGDYVVNGLISSQGHPDSFQSLSMNTKVRVPQISEPFWTLGLILMITFVGTGIGLATFFGATEIGYLALLSLFLPLYVRLKKKDVLSHFTRGQIFGFIQANPGTHYNAIIQHLGLNNGVGAYHLQVLEREGYIKSLRDGIYKRFYPTGVKVPEKRLHLSRLQRDILIEIQKHPGVTQKQISKLLDESKQVVNYHVKILENAGLIRLERIGRETACFAGKMRYVSQKDAYEVADEGVAQVMNI